MLDQRRARENFLNEVAGALSSSGLSSIEVGGKGGTLCLSGVAPVEQAAALEQTLASLDRINAPACIHYHTHTVVDDAGVEKLHLSRFHMP